MYTDREDAIENFIFGEERMCAIQTEGDITLCVKYDVDPEVQIVLVAYTRENFLNLSFSDNHAPTMIILPEKKIAIEITRDFFHAFNRDYWQWSMDEGRVEQFSTGKIFHSNLLNINRSIAEWVLDLVLEKAEERHPFEEVGYAKVAAFNVFVSSREKATYINEEKERAMFTQSYNILVDFPSELIKDFLVHNSDNGLRNEWALRLLDNMFIDERAEHFVNWRRTFEQAFAKLEALPDNDPVKQNRQLLAAVQDKKTVLAEFSSVADKAVKVQVGELKDAIMMTDRIGNPKIGWGKDAYYLNDLVKVNFRNKTIWERKQKD